MSSEGDTAVRPGSAEIVDGTDAASVDGAGNGPGALEDGSAGSSRWSSERLAAWAFGAAVAVSYPVLLNLGSFFWFFRDDWLFITDRELSDPGDLFEPHNAHWSTVPIVAFRLLYAAFGVRSYLPYQMVVVAVHLAVIVLIRAIMRRAGVTPWLATAFAAAGLLFGPGREDILWAFQIGFTGSIMFVLLQLVLADHDGPIGRRDVLALVAGVLGLMSSSPAVVLVAAMTLAVLIRRGWKAALFQSAPLGVIYVAYNVLADPETSPAARPEIDVMVEWVRNGQGALFVGLGQHRPLVIALIALLIVGTAVHLWAPGPKAAPTAWGRLQAMAAPAALFGATFVFMLVSVQSRWFIGPQGARAGRYLYFYAICTLPLLAVAGSALAARWKAAGPVVAALILIPIPAQIDEFDRPPFGPAYHEHRRSMLTSAVRMPQVREVDRDTRPVPDPYMGDNVDVGYLLHAYDTGKLTPSSGDIPPHIDHELTVRLGVRQVTEGWVPECEVHRGAEVVLEPDEGDVWRIRQPVALTVADFGEGSRPVEYRPADGSFLEVQVPDLEIVVRPPRGSDADIQVCTTG